MTTELTDAEVAELEREPVDVERMRRALEGGYAAITVRSKATGRHISFRLTAKRLAPRMSNTHGSAARYLSRSTVEGRVGIAEANAVFVDDDEGYVAKWCRGYAEHWKVSQSADANVLWAAKAVIRWATDPTFDLTEKADIMLAASCCVCHRALRHPESIALGIGPECHGRRTQGRRAERVPCA